MQCAVESIMESTIISIENLLEAVKAVCVGFPYGNQKNFNRILARDLQCSLLWISLWKSLHFQQKISMRPPRLFVMYFLTKINILSIDNWHQAAKAICDGFPYRSQQTFTAGFPAVCCGFVYGLQ